MRWLRTVCPSDRGTRARTASLIGITGTPTLEKRKLFSIARHVYSSPLAPAAPGVLLRQELIAIDGQAQGQRQPGRRHGTGISHRQTRGSCLLSRGAARSSSLLRRFSLARRRPKTADTHNPQTHPITGPLHPANTSTPRHAAASRLRSHAHARPRTTKLWPCGTVWYSTYKHAGVQYVQQ